MKLNAPKTILPFICFAFVFCASPASAGLDPNLWDTSTSPPSRKTQMKDVKVTVAAINSLFDRKDENFKKLRHACELAKKDGARIVFLPEGAITGHAGLKRMSEIGEPIPQGTSHRKVIEMSKEFDLCIAVGTVEIKNGIAYNSYIVADKGKLVGVQRKINLSSDEPRYFAAADKVETFDIGDIRFGISICYDNDFPEIAMIHKLHDVDLILAGHAERDGEWPSKLTPEFMKQKILRQQDKYSKMYRGSARDYNIYILAVNAVGSALQDYNAPPGVFSNHVGTVFGVDPMGDVILKTDATDKFIEEYRTVELKADKKRFNDNTTRNRNYVRVKAMLNKEFDAMGF